MVAIPIKKKKEEKEKNKQGRERKKEIIMGCELPRNSCAMQGISALLNDSQQLKAWYRASRAKIPMLFRKSVT